MYAFNTHAKGVIKDSKYIILESKYNLWIT